MHHDSIHKMLLHPSPPMPVLHHPMRVYQGPDIDKKMIEIKNKGQKYNATISAKIDDNIALNIN